MIKKAKRKPITFPEVEFVQFTEENKNQVFSWATGIQGNVIADFDEYNNPILKIPVTDGLMVKDLICNLGDYLLRDNKSTYMILYPITKKEFQDKYNIINEEILI